MRCVLCGNDKGKKAFEEAYPICDGCVIEALAELNGLHTTSMELRQGRIT